MYPPHENIIYLDKFIVKVYYVNNRKAEEKIPCHTSSLLSLNVYIYLCLKTNREVIFIYLNLINVLSYHQFIIFSKFLWRFLKEIRQFRHLFLYPFRLSSLHQNFLLFIPQDVNLIRQEAVIFLRMG